MRVTWSKAVTTRHGERQVPGWTDNVVPPSKRVQDFASQIRDLSNVPVVLEVNERGVFVTVVGQGSADASGRATKQAQVWWYETHDQGEARDVACAYLYPAAYGFGDDVEPFENAVAQLVLGDQEHFLEEYAAPAIQLLRAIPTVRGKEPQILRMRWDDDPEELGRLCLAFRLAMLLAHDEVNVRLAIARRPLRDPEYWTRHGATVVELTGEQPLGAGADLQEKAGILRAMAEPIPDLARRAADEGGGDVAKGLERITGFESIVVTIIGDGSHIDIGQIGAALQRGDYDRYVRDRVARVLQDKLNRQEWDGEVVDSVTVRLTSPSGQCTVRLRSPDLAGWEQVTRVLQDTASEPLAVAVSQLLPVDQAVQMLPQNLARWLPHQVQWLVTNDPAWMGRLWRGEPTSPASRPQLAEQAARVVGDGWMKLPLDVLVAAFGLVQLQRTLAAPLPAALAELSKQGLGPPEAADAVDHEWWLRYGARLLGSGQAPPEIHRKLAAQVLKASSQELDAARDLCAMLYESDHVPTPVKERVEDFVDDIRVHKSRVIRYYLAQSAKLPRRPSEDLLQEVTQWLREQQGRVQPHPRVDRTSSAEETFWTYIATRSYTAGDEAVQGALLDVVRDRLKRYAHVSELVAWAQRHCPVALVDLWLAGVDVSAAKVPQDLPVVGIAVRRRWRPPVNRNGEAWQLRAQRVDLLLTAREWVGDFRQPRSDAVLSALRDVARNQKVRRAVEELGWHKVVRTCPGWAGAMWAALPNLSQRDQRKVLESLPAVYDPPLAAASRGEWMPRILSGDP